MISQTHKLLLLAAIVLTMASPGFCANAEFYRDRAFAKEARKDFDGAIADYSKAIKLAPNDPIAYTFRGSTKRAKGDLDGAIADHTKAIELEKPYNHRWIASAYASRGAAKQDKGDLEGAIADYSNAISLELKSDLRQLAQEYTSRGTAKQRTGDFDGAIADYTKALHLMPNYLAAAKQLEAATTAKPIAQKMRIASCCVTSGDYLNAGFVKAAGKDFDGAIADYTQALDLLPSDPAAYAARGTAKRDKGDFEGAIADYTKALDIRPSDPAAYVARGTASQNKGDFDGAIADYTKALDLNPNDPATTTLLHEATFKKLATRINVTYFSGLTPGSRRPVPYRAYSGPPLPRQQVAILNLDHVLVSNVDGQRLPLCYSYDATCRPIGPIELLPGEHTITFAFGNNPNNTLSVATVTGVTPIQRSLSVIAGADYHAKRNWRNAGDCKTSRGAHDSSTTCRIDWSVDINDK